MNLMERRRALMGVVDVGPVISDILTLDGIKNTRAGHNPSSTKWEDLSGNNRDFTKFRTNVLWSDNSAVFNGSNTGLSYSGVLFSTTLTEFTIELSVKIGAIGTNSNGYPVFAGDTSTFADREDLIACIPSSEKNIQVVWGIGANVPVGDDIKHLTYVFREDKIDIYLNGVYVRTPNFDYSTTAKGRTKHFIGTRTYGNASNQYFTGDIYRFGICSKALTALEIAERYKRLRVRFG